MRTLAGFDEWILLQQESSLGGKQTVYRFTNGYGASVIEDGIAYGGRELAVLRFTGNGNRSEIAYDTPVTHNVIGGLTDDRLVEALTQIKEMEGDLCA